VEAGVVGFVAALTRAGVADGTVAEVEAVTVLEAVAVVAGGGIAELGAGGAEGVVVDGKAEATGWAVAGGD
jgi:hypothetical protein